MLRVSAGCPRLRMVPMPPREEPDYRTSSLLHLVMDGNQQCERGQGSEYRTHTMQGTSGARKIRGIATASRGT